MESAPHLLITTSINALGFLGVLAITLLPLRALTTLRSSWRLWPNSSGKAAFVVVATAAVTAISFSVPIAVRVFRCLTEGYCGPGVASGWLYLSFIGVLYVGFEVVSNVAL